MSSTLLLTSAMISVIYLLVKFLEMRYVLGEEKSPKTLVRDAVIVFISVLIGDYTAGQFAGQTNSIASPDVFVGSPEF